MQKHDQQVGYMYPGPPPYARGPIIFEELGYLFKFAFRLILFLVFCLVVLWNVQNKYHITYNGKSLGIESLSGLSESSLLEPNQGHGAEQGRVGPFLKEKEAVKTERQPSKFFTTRLSSISIKRRYLVKRGDKIEDIAKRFDVGVDFLCYVNHLSRWQPLYEGDIVQIPASSYGI